MTKRIVGLIVIVTGILLLLSNLTVLSFVDVWGVVFSLGIMIIGIAGIIEKKHFDIVMGMFIIFGGLYFISNIGMIDHELVNSMLWPTAIILIGLSLIFNVSKKKVSSKAITTYTAVFAGIEEKNESKNYVSSEIVAIFGGAEVDYRKINIKDNQASIDITAIFGGVTIFVPDDVKVIVKGVPMFGGAENKAVSKEDAKCELIINYTAIFGGVEIKN